MYVLGTRGLTSPILPDTLLQTPAQPREQRQRAGLEGGAPGRDGRYDGAHAQDHLDRGLLPGRRQARAGAPRAVRLH